MFKDFNKTGHRALSADVVAELAELGQRHGLKFEVKGGQLGAHSLTLSLVASSADTTAADDAARRLIDVNGRSLGLAGSDYGLVFTSQGKRYRFTGVSPSRPKYPIDGVCESTGRKFKFARTAAIAIQMSRPKQLTPAQAAIAAPTNRAPEALDPRYSQMAQF
jgi:hypothetical protein